MDKPITVKIEELKQNLAKDVNNSGLHLYITHSVLKELCDEVHFLLTNLTKQELDTYKQTLANAESNVEMISNITES